MDNRNVCLDCMDFNCAWSDWRTNLTKSLAGEGRFYWQDEAVENMAGRLNEFLEEKVFPESSEEELLKQMWTVSAPDERRTLISVFLKVIEQYSI